MLEHVQTAALAVDADGRLGVCNPAAGRVLEVDPQSVLGRLLGDFVDSPEPLRSLTAALDEARRAGEDRNRFQLAVATAGGERVFGYSISILGGKESAAMFFTDLTQTLAVEKKVSEEHRFAEVGRIAGAMAHELKSPLATVEVYVELLRRSVSATPVATDQVGIILDQVHLCQERLRAILRSISPDGAQPGGVVLLDLNQGVETIVADYQHRFPEAKVLVRRAPGEHLVAFNDTDMVSVLGNLLGNALEVTGGKGPVEMTLTATTPGKVVLRVADGGPGLPVGDVFAPFFSTKSSGTGLGLWLVRKTVERARGTVTARNRSSGGAAFTVTLPTPYAGRLKGRSILVVEDERSLRDVYAGALRAAGAEVIAVAGGEQVPEGHAWAGAAIDFHLPGTTGVETAARLPAGVPVLICSGDAFAAGALGDLTDRAAWFTIKPVALDRYVDLISLLVEDE